MYISKDAIIDVPMNKKLEDESQEVRSLCFEVGKGYSISNRVVSNINKIILKYNLEIQR